MDHYPDWLGRDLVAGNLPWSEGVASSLPAFLDRYTLHDSYWIGLYAEPGRCATLLLRWDTFWTQGEVPFPGSLVAEWPLLAVRFDALDRSEVRLRDHGLASALSGPTNRAADAHRTHLADHHGGDATLVHAPGVRLLCLSRSREPLPLLVPAETV
jgi:hypothetical protein